MFEYDWGTERVIHSRSSKDGSSKSSFVFLSCSFREKPHPVKLSSVSHGCHGRLSMLFPVNKTGHSNGRVFLQSSSNLLSYDARSSLSLWNELCRQEEMVETVELWMPCLFKQVWFYAEIISTFFKKILFVPASMVIRPAIAVRLAFAGRAHSWGRVKSKVEWNMSLSITKQRRGGMSLFVPDTQQRLKSAAWSFEELDQYWQDRARQPLDPPFTRSWQFLTAL